MSADAFPALDDASFDAQVLAHPGVSVCVIDFVHPV